MNDREGYAVDSIAEAAGLSRPAQVVTDPLGELALIEQVMRARLGVAEAQADLRHAIRHAFNNREGYTVDDIAEAAGLSRPRIYQIVKGD